MGKKLVNERKSRENTAEAKSRRWTPRSTAPCGLAHPLLVDADGFDPPLPQAKDSRRCSLALFVVRLVCERARYRLFLIDVP